MMSYQERPSRCGELVLPSLLVISAGAFFVVYKLVLQWIPPLTALCCTMTGTAAFYLLFVLWKRGMDSFRVTKRQLLFLGVLGLCATLLNGSLIWAVELTQASQASLLVRSDVIFSVVLGVLFFGERLSRPGILGLVLMGAGAFLVLKVFPWQLKVVSEGELLALLAGLLLSTNAVIIKYYLADVPSDVVICYNSCIMSSLSFILILITSSIGTFALIQSLVPMFAVGLAIILSASMFQFYYRSLSEHPVWAVRGFLLLSPFVTIILGLWILGETVSWAQWIGGIFLFCGGLLLIKDLGNQSVSIRTRPNR